jgi:4a-hydroxytetrahydrobiopterin dehydratase
MTDLKQQRCAPCEGGIDPLDRGAAENLLSQAKGWTLNDAANEIRRTFNFKNFYETMAFANAVAWVANREDHHPDMELSYKRCVVRYSTHAVNGLSMNDFICAAKVNALIDE